MLLGLASGGGNHRGGREAHVDDVEAVARHARVAGLEAVAHSAS